VAVWSKTQDCGRLSAEIADSNSSEGIVARLLYQFFFVEVGPSERSWSLVLWSPTEPQKWGGTKKKTSGDLALKLYMQATHLLPFYLYIHILMMTLMDGNGLFIGNSFFLHNKYSCAWSWFLLINSSLVHITDKIYKMSDFSFLSAEERLEWKEMATGFVSETQRQCEFLLSPHRETPRHPVSSGVCLTFRKIRNIHVQ
jgi:hypothetical protein